MSNRPKKGRGAIAKIVFVSSLVITATLGSVGMLMYGASLTDSDIKSVADISGAYGRNVGITNIKQEVSTNTNGMVSTTLKVEANSDDVSKVLAYLANDIDEVTSGELVNLSLKVTNNKEENKDYRIGFFPTSSSAYSSDEFKNLKDVTKSLTTVVPQYDITLRSNTTGSTLTLNAGVINGIVTDFESTNELVRIRDNIYSIINRDMPFILGDTYNITFSNLYNSIDEEPIFSYQNIILNEKDFKEAATAGYVFQQVAFVNTTEHETYQTLEIRSAQYSQLGGRNGNSQLVFLTDSNIDQLNQNMDLFRSYKTYEHGKIVPLERYSIFFRNDFNGVNLLSFKSYLAS